MDIPVYVAIVQLQGNLISHITGLTIAPRWLQWSWKPRCRLDEESLLIFFKEKKTWWTYPKNSNRVVLRDPIPSSGYVRIVQHFRQWESKRYTSIPASYLRRWSLSIVIDHPRSLNRDTFIWLLHAMCFVEDQLHLDSNGGNLRTAVVLTRQRNRKTSSSLEILLDWSIFTKIYTSPENYTVLPWKING